MHYIILFIFYAQRKIWKNKTGTWYMYSTVKTEYNVIYNYNYLLLNINLVFRGEIDLKNQGIERQQFKHV